MNSLQRICAQATQKPSGEVLFVITWCAMVFLTIAVCANGHYSFLNVLAALLAPFFATEFIIQLGHGSRVDALISFVISVFAAEELVRIFTSVS
ncbi:hypothetical protein [Erythrobacter aureus]|uniref:hypothetical protein n=1 Tax=Erythrobacter aureus TaxID=2182384 RepID=UPI0013B37C76|nr:hypothetical protein [Erythrobacter aureus]